MWNLEDDTDGQYDGGVPWDRLDHLTDKMLDNMFERLRAQFNSGLLRQVENGVRCFGFEFDEGFAMCIFADDEPDLENGIPRICGTLHIKLGPLNGHDTDSGLGAR